MCLGGVGRVEGDGGLGLEMCGSGWISTRLKRAVSDFELVLGGKGGAVGVWLHTWAAPPIDLTRVRS